MGTPLTGRGVIKCQLNIKTKRFSINKLLYVRNGAIDVQLQWTTKYWKIGYALLNHVVCDSEVISAIANSSMARI